MKDAYESACVVNRGREADLLVQRCSQERVSFL